MPEKCCCDAGAVTGSSGWYGATGSAPVRTQLWDLKIGALDARAVTVMTACWGGVAVELKFGFEKLVFIF
jgi:hypothetical protein